MLQVSRECKRVLARARPMMQVVMRTIRKAKERERLRLHLRCSR